MIYLYLVSIWPLLNYVKDNFLKINNYRDIFIILAVFLCSSYLFGKIIKKYSKDGIERYLLVSFVLIVLFFNYGNIIDLLRNVGNPYIKTTYIWLFFSGIFAYGAWKISRSLEVQKATKLFIGIVVVIPALEITHSYWFHSATMVSHQKNQDLTFAFKYKPNVYYILVDAYARQDTLKEVAEFDNEPFLKELEQKGFLVSRNAHSNYHFTSASLSATMNMAYHPYQKDGSVRKVPMLESLKGNNQVRRVFKNNNYKIINIPAHWHEISCHGHEDKCVKNPSAEIYQSFLSTTPLRIFPLPNNYVSIEDIQNTVDIFPNKTKFIFAHLAQVHDAIYDEFGNYHSTLHPAFSNIQEAQRYINSIKVINKKLLNLVKYIQKKDENSIIIIQADHGPTYIGNQTPQNPSYWLTHEPDLRLKNKEDMRYTFGILSAIYFPPSLKNNNIIKKYFSESPSLINIFRYVFAYLSEQEPQPLKDESHFLYWDNSAKVYREDNIDHLKN